MRDEIIDEIHGAVAAAGVDDNQLDVIEARRIRLERIQAAPDAALLVERGHDDGDGLERARVRRRARAA